jgi:hypothetical protein
MTYWQEGHMDGSSPAVMMLAVLGTWAFVAAVCATHPSRALPAPTQVPVATRTGPAGRTGLIRADSLTGGRGVRADYCRRLEALSVRNAS